MWCVAQVVDLPPGSDERAAALQAPAVALTHTTDSAVPAVTRITPAALVAGHPARLRVRLSCGGPEASGDGSEAMVGCAVAGCTDEDSSSGGHVHDQHLRLHLRLAGRDVLAAVLPKDVLSAGGACIVEIDVPGQDTTGLAAVEVSGRALGCLAKRSSLPAAWMAGADALRTHVF